MTYRYLYQTSGNENREGTIRARNRDAAYGLLRKRGIRPYRLIGDDPSPWRMRLVWFAVSLALAAAVVLTVDRLAFHGDPFAPMVRQQIYGDRTLIDSGVLCGWSNVFDTPLQLYLAAYAMPGRTARPPILTADDFDAFRLEVERRVKHESGECAEHCQMRRIVEWMRLEMKAYLDAGGEVGDYLELLEERQQTERDFRIRASTSVEHAPASYLYRTWMGVNARLRDMGIEPLEMPEALVNLIY